MERHLTECVHNPANCGCKTCGNIYWGDQDESGRSFCNEEKEGYPNLVNCKHWKHVGLTEQMKMANDHLWEIKEDIIEFMKKNLTVPLPEGFTEKLEALADIVTRTLGK